MKRIIITLSLLIAITLILSGCLPQPQPVDNSETKTTEEPQSADINEPSDAGATDADLDITEQDLDKLKTDIESMDYEDLNSLNK